jgi:hypothetical protein
MSAVRRAVAVLPVAALAMAAQPAQAATITTVPCFPYVQGVSAKMPIIGTGFTPSGLVRVHTSTGKATPQILTSSSSDAAGAFGIEAFPPSFSPSSRNLQTFNLIGEDRTNPAAPIFAASTFQMARFGLTSSPASPKRPGQKVRYTARGFTAGKPVYIHFRFGGKTRRTVKLGVAKGACGIVSKRMRALPTKVRYGDWRTYTNQSRTSASAEPLWKDGFRITKRFF